MKRALLILLMLVVALPAFAFKTRRGAERIGILDSEMRRHDGSWAPVATMLQERLTRELRERGFDAYETGRTFSELEEAEQPEADYYVEVLAEDGSTEGVGGVGVDTGVATVVAEVVIARAAARVRVYDAELREIGTFELVKRSTSFVPTGVGVGGWRGALWFAVPVFERARYRAALRAVAEDAAVRVAEAVR